MMSLETLGINPQWQSHPVQWWQRLPAAGHISYYDLVVLYQTTCWSSMAVGDTGMKVLIMDPTQKRLILLAWGES